MQSEKQKKKWENCRRSVQIASAGDRERKTERMKERSALCWPTSIFLYTCVCVCLWTPHSLIFAFALQLSSTIAMSPACPLPSPSAASTVFRIFLAFTYPDSRHLYEIHRDFSCPAQSHTSPSRWTIYPHPVRSRDWVCPAAAVPRMGWSEKPPAFPVRCKEYWINKARISTAC